MLYKMLEARRRYLDIKAEMALTPEIELLLAETLREAIGPPRIVTGSPAPPVVISKQAAIWLLEILEQRRRGRGQQASDDIGPDILVQIGRLRKRQMIDSGESAENAHACAADEAAELGRHYRINLKSSTLARYMQNRKQI